VRESASMELHRLAIAVVALLLAATTAIAAGRIAFGDSRSSNVHAPTSAPSFDGVPAVRLGTPRADGYTPPPLLEPPTPRADVTPRARQARESSSSEPVLGGGG